MRRMWINQPSTLQRFHKWHGMNVLAQKESEKVSRVYFLSGPIISQQIPSNVLSTGWRKN